MTSEPIFTPPKVGEAITSNATGRTYRFGAQIGEGNFGKTFECDDDWNNRLVAKVLLPKGDYKEVRARWISEFGKLLRLRHPNITYIHDVFEFRTTFYIIMERCSFTLEQLLQEPTTKPLLFLLPVANQILQAIHYVHHEGFAHKDLHAGNIFAAQHFDAIDAKPVGWTFKVGDLGIAREESEIDPETTTLAQWMLPPESLDAKRFGLVGKRTDIYHLGLLLLRMVSERTVAYSHDQILNGQPRKDAEALVSPYAGAISRCLRRTVAERTSTALRVWVELVEAAKR